MGISHFLDMFSNAKYNYLNINSYDGKTLVFLITLRIDIFNDSIALVVYINLLMSLR